MSTARRTVASPFGMIDKGLLAVAAVGWGLFAYSAVSSRSDEHLVQDEIARLHQEVQAVAAERNKIAQERDQTIPASRDLQHLQGQTATVKQELQRLETMRERVSQAIDQAHPKLVTLAARSGEGNEGTSVSSAAPASPSKHQIRAAREALVDLGHANFEADGVFGPCTSKAVEAFERARGLPITGKLRTSTLQALRTHVASLGQ